MTTGEPQTTNWWSSKLSGAISNRPTVLWKLFERSNQVLLWRTFHWGRRIAKLVDCHGQAVWSEPQPHFCRRSYHSQIALSIFSRILSYLSLNFSYLLYRRALFVPSLWLFIRPVPYGRNSTCLRIGLPSKDFRYAVRYHSLAETLQNDQSLDQSNTRWRSDQARTKDCAKWKHLQPTSVGCVW